MEFDGSVLAITLVTANGIGVGGACGIGFGDWAGSVIQPGMRIRNNSSDRERKTNLFNVVTSKNILPAISTCP